MLFGILLLKKLLHFWKKLTSMKRSRCSLVLATLATFILSANAQQTGYPQQLFSRAEKSLYLETTSSSEVEEFISVLAKTSNLVTVETFGKSLEGKPLILVIMAKPRISTPQEAIASGKPVIYIQGNIHAGEVEGKEASMQIMREIAFGPKQHLLDNQILLFCPNYNPDGNDKLGENRPSQDGSPKLTGVRQSGEGFDLNREGMKLEALESKALVNNVFNRWDPILFVDLHTDNGSWHGYAVNVAPSFTSIGSPQLLQYTKDMITSTADRILERSGMPVWWHGYMRMGNNSPAIFTAYDHHPRYITNYFGLRNRMGILSETFAHQHFEKRIWSNYLLIHNLLEYTNGHAAEMSALVEEADRISRELISGQSANPEMGIRYELTKEADTVKILVRETVPYTDERGRRRVRGTGQTYWKDSVLHYNAFVPTRMTRVPRGYFIPANCTGAVEKLREHGIVLTPVNKRIRTEADRFVITEVRQSEREAYGGHKTVMLEGSFSMSKQNIGAGSWYVDLLQPLAWVAFYLLEPESDDGLAHWNYLDEQILGKDYSTGKVFYPILKVYSEPQLD